MKAKKILLLAIPMLALGGITAAAVLKEPEPIVIKAEGEEAVAEEQPQEESKIENFKNTYLVPLLSGVSVASVFSLAMSVGLSVYNSKVNKKTRTLIANCIDQTFSTLKMFNAIRQELEMANKLSEATTKSLDEAFRKLFDQLGLLEKATDKVEAVKEAIVLLGEMQKELAKLDKQAVSSGVTKKLVQLEAKLKELE